MKFIKRKKPNPWKNFAFGLVGGTAGTLAMEFYWKGVQALIHRDPRQEQKPPDKNRPLEDISVVGKQQKQGESSTAAVGRTLYEKLTGKEPTPEQAKTKLSDTVHWSY